MRGNLMERTIDNNAPLDNSRSKYLIKLDNRSSVRSRVRIFSN